MGGGIADVVSDAESSSLIPVKLFLAPVYRIRTETSVSFFFFLVFSSKMMKVIYRVHHIPTLDLDIQKVK